MLEILLIGRKLIYNVGYRSCYLCGYKHSEDRAHREFRRIFGDRCCENCYDLINGLSRKKYGPRSSIFMSLYRVKDGKGYFKIKRPHHIFADVNGFVLEHRIVVEDYLSEFLGFTVYIAKEYVVHHKNEDKTDNRLENLQVMNKKEHSIHHNPKGIKTTKKTIPN